MNITEARSLVDRYIDAYNRKDIDDMLLTVHPEVEFMNIAAGVVNAHASGERELRALAQQSLPLFSERRQTIESFELQGSMARAAISFHAVVAADMANGLRKGHVISLSGQSEFQFRDGAISKITDIS